MPFEFVVFPVTEDGDSLDAIAEVEATELCVGMWQAGKKIEAWCKEKPLEELANIEYFETQVMYAL